jgi:outer membrane protein, heavy metal efflux system
VPLIRKVGGCAQGVVLSALLVSGCASAARRADVAIDETRSAGPSAKAAEGEPAVARRRSAPPRSLPVVKPVNYDEPAEDSVPVFDGGQGLFAGQVELSLPVLIEEVQRRNPSASAALAAWGAAAERAPQVVTLDDPTLLAMVAPASFWPNNQRSGIISLSQKLPWAGKLELRGRVAEWSAVAASFDHDEVQLRLAEAARLAFYDYYHVERRISLNAAAREAVDLFRETARLKLEANQAREQDVLQADVELGKIEQRRIELDQLLQVSVARINTLLHRDPDLPLPPSPEKLAVATPVPDAAELRERALQQRPELAALAARLNSEQNALALTIRDYYPDVEIMGRYDSFWTDPNQRSQIGVNLNIPINRQRREAAVCEATFRVNKLQAEYGRDVDLVKNEVQGACARLDAARRSVRLYADKILPAAQDNVRAAISGYRAGTVDFLRLVQTQRELIELQENYQQVVVDLNRNRAELDRVVGTVR